MNCALAGMTADKPVDAPRDVPVKAEPQAVVQTIPNIDRRHGDRRAEVIGIAVMNEYGDPLHLMTPHSRILVRISVRACAEIERPDVGFMMRNHLGLDFSGMSAAAEGHRLPHVAKGKTLTVDFQIDIPELYPGAFSFSPWIEDAGRVCDWIDNAVTVQMARGEGSVYGYIHWPSRIGFNSALETEQGIG
jgi:hypothetical protein